MTQPATGPNGHVYIVSAARTPIGRFGGGLAGVPGTELGGVAIRAAVERAGLDSETAVMAGAHAVDPGLARDARLSLPPGDRVVGV